MNTRLGRNFRPKACQRCGGDAYLSRGEDVEWVCLQCGRTVAEPAQVLQLDLTAKAAPETVAVAASTREAA